MNQRQAAALLGISQMAVCRLETGLEDPDSAPLLEVGLRIERVTKGAVRAWALLPEAKRRWARCEEGQP